MSNRAKESIIAAVALFQLVIMLAALAHSFYVEFAFERDNGVTMQELANLSEKIGELLTNR
jgi:hypothetical protein